MTLGDVGRIVRGVSGRGTSPEYPDVRFLLDRWVPTDPDQHIDQREVDRITGERSREDEALRRRKRSSLWRRLFGRRR
jgi:hypothetical protein